MRLFERLSHRPIRKTRTEKQYEIKNDMQNFQSHSNKISKKLKDNLDTVNSIMGSSADLVERTFSFGRKGDEIQAALFFIDGLVDMDVINESIVKTLMVDSRLLGGNSDDDLQDVQSIQQVQDRLLTVGEVKTIETIEDSVKSCLSGNAIFFADGFIKALEISAKGWEKRAISEPVSETSVRGPREGFTENLRTNTSMIRRQIKSPQLRIKDPVVGERTHTKINIIYVEGIADPELVKEVEQRISKIDTDAILATGYLEQYMDDSPSTIFPTIWSTEKPDALAGKLLEGRVAVAVDGSPFVMTVPMLFIENFQAAEDYIMRYHYATALRLLRMISFIICLFAPALYIALTAYHHELIPTTLLFTVAAASEGVPFSAVVEVMVMMLIFETLREAGIRMPRPIGQTVSIVGALVMGEAAVSAGLVGAPVVIVVAITAVSTFAIPYLADCVAILRWFLIIMAAVMGIYGITIGSFAILIHMVSLRSFGAHYMSPMAPLQITDLKDTFVRVPLWAMRTRPRSLNPQDLVRQNMDNPFSNKKKTRVRGQKK